MPTSSLHDPPAPSASPSEPPPRPLPVLVAHEVHRSTGTSVHSNQAARRVLATPPTAVIQRRSPSSEGSAGETPVLAALRPAPNTAATTSTGRAAASGAAVGGAASPTANSFTVTTDHRYHTATNNTTHTERDPSVLFASEVSSYRGIAPLYSTFAAPSARNINNNSIKSATASNPSQLHSSVHGAAGVVHRGSWGTSTPLAALGKLTAARRFFATQLHHDTAAGPRSCALPVFISSEVVHGSAAAPTRQGNELVTRHDVGAVTNGEDKKYNAKDTPVLPGRAPSWLLDAHEMNSAATARTPAADVPQDGNADNNKAAAAALPTLRQRSTLHRDKHGRHKRRGHRAHGHRKHSSSNSNSDSSSSSSASHGRRALLAQQPTPRRRTRNANALYAMPWDQRPFLPTTSHALLQPFFAVLASPRFWEKLDWAVRASWFTVLPTMILTLEPATQRLFPIPSAVANLAYWITMPTFGAGLREFYFALKGFGMCLVLLFIVIALRPGQSFGTLVLFFVETFVAAFVAEEVRATATYCLCTYIMQYLTDPAGTGYAWAAQYFLTLLIALGFGLAAFLIPFIRWSSAIAEHYIKVYGNSLAYAAETLYTNFWAITSLDRELAREHVAQLLHTAEECVPRIETALSESEYEPHSGLYLARLNARYALLRQLYKVLAAGQEVLEAVVAAPESVHGPMSGPLGVRLAGELRVMAAGLAAMVMRVADVAQALQMADVEAFRMRCDEFERYAHDVQDDVVISLTQHSHTSTHDDDDDDDDDDGEYYRAGRADVLVGVFLFNLARACEVAVEHAAAEVHAAGVIAAGGSWTRHFVLYRALFWWRDVRSAWAAVRTCAVRFHRRGALTRRFKEAVKMALCMFVAGSFQHYALRDSPTSAAAGAAVIAQLYSASGGESFQYASGRLMGTVLGSVISLMIVQLASGRLGVLYGGIALLGFAGAYVQAAPGFYPVGNTIVGGLISVITAYTDSSVALVSIQQNVFASLVYFAVAFLVWPVRSRTRVRMELDLSLRYTRDALRRLLRNVDLPNSVDDVVTDVRLVLSSWSERVRLLEADLPRGQSEPTITSVAFPLAAWTRVLGAQKKLLATAWVMLDAYRGFMHSSSASSEDHTVIVVQNGQMVLSVHWVLLHRIAPEAIALADALSDTIELFLQSLASATVGSNEVLTQLQRRMRQAQRRMLRIFSQTLQVRVPGVSQAEYNNNNNNAEGDRNGGRDEAHAAGHEPIATRDKTAPDNTAPLPPLTTTTTTTNMKAEKANEAEGGSATQASRSWSHVAARLHNNATAHASATTIGTATVASTAERTMSAVNGPRMTYHITAEERAMLRELLQNAVTTSSTSTTAVVPVNIASHNVSHTNNHSFAAMALPALRMNSEARASATSSMRGRTLADNQATNNINNTIVHAYIPQAVRQNAVIVGPVSIVPDTSNNTTAAAAAAAVMGEVIAQHNNANTNASAAAEQGNREMLLHAYTRHANEQPTTTPSPHAEASMSMRTMSHSRAEVSMHASQSNVHYGRAYDERSTRTAVQAATEVGNAAVTTATTDLLLAGGRRSRTQTQAPGLEQPLLLQLAQQQLRSSGVPPTFITSTTAALATAGGGGVRLLPGNETSSASHRRAGASMRSTEQQQQQPSPLPAMHYTSQVNKDNNDDDDEYGGGVMVVEEGEGGRGEDNNNAGREDMQHIASSSRTRGLDAALRHAWRRMREEANAAPHQAFQNVRQRRLYGGNAPRYSEEDDEGEGDEEETRMQRDEREEKRRMKRSAVRCMMKSTDVIVQGGDDEEEEGPPATPALVTPLHPGLRAGGSVDEAQPLRLRDSPAAASLPSSSSSSLLLLRPHAAGDAPRLHATHGGGSSLSSSSSFAMREPAGVYENNVQVTGKEVQLAQVQRELNYRDLHSIEAFLFGVSLLVENMNELQHAMLDMQYASEMARKL